VIAGCRMSLPVTTSAQNDSGILKDQPSLSTTLESEANVTGKIEATGFCC